MRDGRIAAAMFPEAPVGAVRLWDSATSWSHLEVADGQFGWGNLDRAVETAEANHARALLVLGQTPEFHASKPGQEGAYGPGANNMPDIYAWRRYVRTVAERYGDRIDYQVWNEPNVANYWAGTPQEMARLTVTASEEIRDAVPDATVVAWSFPLRLAGQRAWFAEFWSQELILDQ